MKGSFFVRRLCWLWIFWLPLYLIHLCVCVSVSVDSNDISFNLRSKKWFKPLSLWTHLRWKYINQILWNNEGNIKLLVCSNEDRCWARVEESKPSHDVFDIWKLCAQAFGIGHLAGDCMHASTEKTWYLWPICQLKFPLVFMFPQFPLSSWPQEVKQ